MGAPSPSRAELVYNPAVPSPPLPYRIAVLCYLFDAQGRVLLLHRRKPPNRDLYSPIGGKLEQHLGESPTQCAVREILEETRLAVDIEDLHLTGMVSEHGYEGLGHWLIFLYELTQPVSVEPVSFDEGTLEWHAPEAIDRLNIPESDRKVIWPQFWAHRSGFFAAHIDCQGPEMAWRIEQTRPGEERDATAADRCAQGAGGS